MTLTVMLRPLAFRYIQGNTQLYCKGVSDLKMCMDYFALPGRNFPAQCVLNDKKEKSSNLPKTFRLTTLASQY
jgi:hypothetical protein